MWKGELPARPAASPGLLRRRYSVPETIMRKYRLAQQKSDMEEAGQSSASPASTAARGTCHCCGPRGSRRDRDPMRKSALLRLWGRAGASPVRACCCPPGTRSLDGSHSELRTPRCLTPKRLRLDSSRDREGALKTHTSALLTYSDPPPELTTSITSEKTESPTYSDRTALLTDITSDCQTSLQPEHLTYAVSDGGSFTDSSETFTTSMPTTKETEFDNQKCCSLMSNGSYIDGRISERSVSAENNDSNLVPFDQQLSIDTQKYDILEIVVSETLNVQPTTAVKSVVNEKVSSPIRSAVLNKRKQNVDIDEYVSNILVESLNSLTDQLESMNASMGYDKKLNIVEKEIKVKLQNTGVNTIVHLSPTSNNQIIFGNEELCNSDDRHDNENNQRKLSSVNIRESVLSTETNNNLTSSESMRDNNSNHSHQQQKGKFLNITNTENVNKSILHQIQKLFKDEFRRNDQAENPLPEISHIEISNVDVFLNDNAGDYRNSDTIEIQTQANQDNGEVLGGVGTGNYYEELEENTLVPRFSALPHSDSMEVNTSSSDDTEILGSECTSLVDSLDDPNSPRSILLRRAYTNNIRSELVRSSIDVLDLLPENTSQDDIHSPKEKGEAFFIRIKDDNCDCEKENIVVADHMPETIKQRLYRRHRKREQRMECVRRSKVKQLKKDIIKQKHNEIYKSKKEIEKECMAIINTLIEDVIAKIAQDEYKYMRIKQRSNNVPTTKSEENLNRRVWKKENESNRKSNKSKMVHSHSCYDYTSKDLKAERSKRSKHSSQLNTLSTPEEHIPKRIYQKSEIHDGNNCIEILEILEYVNNSQSSTETTNSDENHNGCQIKNKKSRIPIPVYERIQRIPKGSSHMNSKNTCGRTPPLLSRERSEKTQHLLTSMLLDVFHEDNDPIQDIPIRRNAVPYEPRTRSNSLRFQNSFDIIPEEKSSLSMESTGEDLACRRASAPSLGDSLLTDQEEQPKKSPSPKKLTRYKDLKSAGTSPMPDVYKTQSHAAAMTSPIRKSASTSPIRLGISNNKGNNGTQHVSQPRPLQRRDDEGIARTFAPPLVVQRTASTIFVEFYLSQGSERRKSLTTQYEEQIRNIQSDPEGRRERKVKTHNCLKDNKINEVTKERRRKSDRVKDTSIKDRYEEKVLSKNMYQKKKSRSDRSEVGSEGSRDDRDGSSSSSESGGSLLCSLAPAWLSARRRRRRAASSSGDWAVTVAGSCAAALPNDVEMRLRFPDPHARAPHPPRAPPSFSAVECGTDCSRASRAPPHAPHAPHGPHAPHSRRRTSDDAGRLTLTVKKEASDSSVLASKSVKKSSDLLPDLETFRASRCKTKSSLKTRRGYSLHCWLPEEDPTQIRARNGLSVLGSAIVPEQKPRVPTMSERDLTRLCAPRRRFSCVRP
ncbi:uncharacterized protein LOC123701005 [Colias croceus]|uniref:uncharacterized protein LOC123701005 n=1 Tax=Colias crocea TaxID=72248 RepID=UPI001E27D4ED|nr:uncharacterized protein LOC123701005 [Colias croceus]